MRPAAEVRAVIPVFFPRPILYVIHFLLFALAYISLGLLVSVMYSFPSLSKRSPT